MKISYEDAYYYKILLQSSYIDEVDKWIEDVINSNETLDGIYLDLVCAYNLKKNSLNELISCLHNYIGDNIINDEYVSNKLRLFVKCKFDSNEIDEIAVTEVLCNMCLSSEKLYDKYWNDFYNIIIYKDFLDEGLLEENDFKRIVKDFLDTGILYSFNDFWNSRDIKNRNKNRNRNINMNININRLNTHTYSSPPGINHTKNLYKSVLV